MHSPMGWGGMRNAPTQPATQGEDTVGDGMNGDVSGTNCEQIVHSPKGWGGKIVTPTQPARANEYLLTVSRTQIEHSPMGWGGMQGTPTQPVADNTLSQ